MSNAMLEIHLKTQDYCDMGTKTFGHNECWVGCSFYNDDGNDHAHFHDYFENVDDDA